MGKIGKEEEYSGSTHKYDDIIALPHPVSPTHPPMSIADRAAQFSPFAALTGHDAVLQETARLTQPRRILDEYEIAILDEKLQWIYAHVAEHPKITAVFFVPDEKKEGGSYETVTGHVKKLDVDSRLLYMENGVVICVEQLTELVLEKK